MLRRGIALFAVLQVLGFAFDAVWHGLLHPGFEAASVGEMVVHLATVHLPLYLGVVGFLAAIALSLARDARRGTASPALWVALGGATVQTAGEGWHVWSHLRLAPEAVVPATLSLVGFVVALVALGVDWHRRRTASPAHRGDRRAA